VHTHTEENENVSTGGLPPVTSKNKMINQVVPEILNQENLEMPDSSGMASSMKEQHQPIDSGIIISAGSTHVERFKPTIRQRTGPGGIKKLELHVSSPNSLPSSLRGRDSPNMMQNVYRHTGTSTMKSEVGTENLSDGQPVHVGSVNYHQQ